MAKAQDNQQTIAQLLQMLQGLGSGSGGQTGFPNFQPWSNEPSGSEIDDFFTDPSQAPGLTEGVAGAGGWGAQNTVDDPNWTPDPSDPNPTPPQIQQGSWQNPWAPNALTGGPGPAFGLQQGDPTDPASGWSLPTVATPERGWSPVAYAGMMGAQGQVGSAYINALGRAHTDPLTAISRERAKSIGDLLNVVGGGQQERQTLGLKSAEERKTLQDQIGGELAKIYAGATSGTTGKLAEIAATGTEERETLGTKQEDTLEQILNQAAEERAGMETKGTQERLTQEEQLAGVLDQIQEKGLEDRLGTKTSGEQDRLTLLKQIAGEKGHIQTKGTQERYTQKQASQQAIQQLLQKGYQERQTLGKQQLGDKALTRLKGGQERQTQAQQLAGIINQIKQKGGQERTTLADQITGELGKIGATGEQTRLTQARKSRPSGGKTWRTHAGNYLQEPANIRFQLTTPHADARFHKYPRRTKI